MSNINSKMTLAAMMAMAFVPGPGSYVNPFQTERPGTSKPKRKRKHRQGKPSQKRNKYKVM